MSESPSSGPSVLNWRGPLLAAGIFAVVFGLLLLMAHLNQSKTSDEASSFRQDPYGTSLLFDALERSGHRVKRSQDENSLKDQDAAATTAVFIGGYDFFDIETGKGEIIRGAKFHDRLEEFLERGGRVVLVQHDPGVSSASKPDDKAKPRGLVWETKKSWGVETKYAEKRGSGPTWAAPVFPAMPPGSEPMYLTTESPWLRTDEQWTVLYSGPVDPPDALREQREANGGSPAHVYLAMRPVGDGELVVASQESFLMNEAIKTHPDPVLLDFLTGGRPVIWVDETLHGLHQDEGVLWLVRRYRLQTALLLFWATLLTLLWTMSGDLVRRPAGAPSTEIVRYGERAGVAAQRLLQRSVLPEQVVAECWEQFRRRSPHDAQAISADLRWGPRLRAALAQPPLAGYKELRNLIAEHRTSAKGLAHRNREATDQRLASRAKKTPEEA